MLGNRFVAVSEAYSHLTIGDDKIFTERNVIIQRGVNDMKMCGDGLLEMTKPWKIDCKIR